MKLRKRIIDNYDPDTPWVVETPLFIEQFNTLHEQGVTIRKWVEDNCRCRVVFHGRKIGFDDSDEALLFYLTFLPKSR